MLGRKTTAHFKTDKVLALLAYLAVEGQRPYRREALACLLWPDQPDGKARANLRRALSNLRQTISDQTAVPPHLHITRQTLQFNENSAAQIDVLAFEQYMAAENMESLAQAATLYDGRFLEGFSIPDSVVFEEWMMLKREQYQRQIVHACNQLARHHENLGQHAEALPYAWRQVELEPWQESGQRQLMRLLAATGERNTAVTHYDALCRTLAAELDVAPEPKTAQLAEQIRARITQPDERFTVVHHFLQASPTAKAITTLHQAGDRAVQLAAHEVAITHFTQALALLKTMPDSVERIQQEIELQLALGVPLLSLKGYAHPDVQHVYDRARQLCQQIEADPELIMALFWLASSYSVHGKLKTGLSLAKQMLTVTQQHEIDNLHTINAHVMAGLPLFHLGRFDEALSHFQQGAAIYNPEEHQTFVHRLGQDPGIASSIWVGQTKIHLGYLDQAQQLFQAALARTELLEHPYTLAFTLLMAGFSPNIYFKRYEIAHLHLCRMVKIANKEDFGFFQLLGGFYLGLTRALQALHHCKAQSADQINEGITQMQHALMIEQEQGILLGMSSRLILLANVLGKMKRVEEGLRLLQEAELLISKNGARYFEPELYRVKGQLLQQDKLDSTQIIAAEKSLWQAIEIARQQQARHFEMRSTVSLCRLWQQQGKELEAHQLLATVYDWFIEGFEMSDLQEAQELLTELRR
jgi:DNA-binding SARP family transcriptional activator